MGRTRRRRASTSAIFLVALVAFLPLPARAAGGSLWAVSHGGSGSDLAHGIALAPDGASFVAGRFSGKAAFGGPTLTSAGGSDLFVAAFSPAREHVWSVRGGGTGADWAQDVVRLPSGDVVVAGSFDTKAKLGTATLSGRGRQMFIARLAAATGETMWAIAHGGAKAEHIAAAAADANGDVTVTGYFTGPADLGGGVLPHRGSNDLFVAKYDGDDGKHVWSKAFGSKGIDSASAIAVADTGDLFVTGRITGSVTFGGEPLTAPAGGPFVLRLAGASGAHRWSRTLNATGTANGGAIALDPAGDVLVAGYFYGTLSLGEARRSAGSRDAFLVKLAGGNGALGWARTGGGRGPDTPYDIAVDVAGDVLSIGSFAGTATIGGASIVSAGGSDLFVSLYDGATGGPMWAVARGSKGNDRADALSLDANGNPVVAGWIAGATKFGEEPTPTDGGKDAFIASFAGDDGIPVSTIATPANAVLVNVPMVQTSLVSGTATDDRIGILRVDVTFSVPGAGAVLGTAQATLQCTDEMRTCTWTVAPPVNPGPMVVTAKATDRANNVESPGPSVTIVNI